MNKSKQIKSTYYIYCTKQYLVSGRTIKKQNTETFFSLSCRSNSGSVHDRFKYNRD